MATISRFSTSQFNPTFPWWLSHYRRKVFAWLHGGRIFSWFPNFCRLQTSTGNLYQILLFELQEKSVEQSGFFCGSQGLISTRWDLKTNRSYSTCYRLCEIKHSILRNLSMVVTGAAFSLWCAGAAQAVTSVLSSVIFSTPFQVTNLNHSFSGHWANTFNWNPQTIQNSYKIHLAVECLTGWREGGWDIARISSIALSPFDNTATYCD